MKLGVLYFYFYFFLFTSHPFPSPPLPPSLNSMRLLQTSIASPRRIILWSLWSGLHALVFVIGYLKQKNDPSLVDLNRVGTSIYVSRGAGLVLALDASL